MDKREREIKKRNTCRQGQEKNEQRRSGKNEVNETEEKQRTHYTRGNKRR